MLLGEAVLAIVAGEEVLRDRGGAAGFKADDSDGHCLQNRSGAIAEALEVGTQAPDEAYYSGIDMAVRAGGGYPFVTAHPARIPRYPRAAARMSP